MTADPQCIFRLGCVERERCIAEERCCGTEPDVRQAAIARNGGMFPDSSPSKERVHHLKCWPEFFRRVADGSKPFECRWNDRRYEVGDLLHLTEFDPDKEISTGAEVWRRVTYILPGTPGARFGINDGWVVLGLAHETAEAQDAARYRWLRSHIAPTIIKRINAEQIDQRPEALDAVIDCRMWSEPLRNRRLFRP